MALWLSALKLVPWKDVILAAPSVVNSARQLWQNIRNKDATSSPLPSVAIPDATSDPLGNLQARIAELERERIQAHATAIDAAKLVSQLPEQQQGLVEAVEKLRVRSRDLILACAILAMLAFKLVLWG